MFKKVKFAMGPQDNATPGPVSSIKTSHIMLSVIKNQFLMMNFFIIQLVLCANTTRTVPQRECDRPVVLTVTTSAV